MTCCCCAPCDGPQELPQEPAFRSFARLSSMAVKHKCTCGIDSETAPASWDTWVDNAINAALSDHDCVPAIAAQQPLTETGSHMMSAGVGVGSWCAITRSARLWVIQIDVHVAARLPRAPTATSKVNLHLLVIHEVHVPTS